MTYFQWWRKEKDAVLADLCDRFLNRRLFQHAEFDPATEYRKIAELKNCLWKRALIPNIILSRIPHPTYRMIFTGPAKRMSACRFICKCRTASSVSCPVHRKSSMPSQASGVQTIKFIFRKIFGIEGKIPYMKRFYEC